MRAAETSQLFEIAEEAYQQRDDAVAAPLFEDLALRGLPAAQFYLGRMYETGRGLAQSFTAAASWYRRAADARVAEAENNLGLLYERGLGVDADAAEAERWFLRAARQGNEDAQLSLARLYAATPGGAVRAYAWSLVAARRGSAVAARNAERLRRTLTLEQRIGGATESELLLDGDLTPRAMG